MLLRAPAAVQNTCNENTDLPNDILTHDTRNTRPSHNEPCDHVASNQCVVHGYIAVTVTTSERRLNRIGIKDVPVVGYPGQRPDFHPIFNRFLPKCVCLRDSAPHPVGGLTAPPSPQLDKVGSQLLRPPPPFSHSWIRHW